MITRHLKKQQQHLNIFNTTLCTFLLVAFFAKSDTVTASGRHPDNLPLISLPVCSHTHTLAKTLKYFESGHREPLGIRFTVSRERKDWRELSWCDLLLCIPGKLVPMSHEMKTHQLQNSRHSSGASDNLVSLSICQALSDESVKRVDVYTRLANAEAAGHSV